MRKSHALNAPLTCTATPIAAIFPGEGRFHLIHTRFDFHLSSNFYLLLRYDHIMQNGSIFWASTGPDRDLWYICGICLWLFVCAIGATLLWSRWASYPTKANPAPAIAAIKTTNHGDMRHAISMTKQAIAKAKSPRSPIADEKTGS